jgi:hypothetical protein
MVSALSSASVHAQSAPVVPVRAAAHGTFDRIVFDWPKAIKYQMRKDGGRASIRFESSASIKLPRSLLSDLNRARGFRVQQDDSNSVTISFTISPDAEIKTFTNDLSVVIDVKGENAPAVLSATSGETTTERTASKPEEPAPAPESLLPATIQSPARPLEAATPKPEAEKEDHAKPPPPSTKPLQASSAVPPTSPISDKPAQAQTPEPAPKPEPPPPAAAEKPKEVALPAPQTPPAPKVFSFALGDTPTHVATLDPHLPTRAAIFLRAGVGYIVFDKKITLSPSALLNGSTPLVDIEAFDMPKNSGYRFTAPPGASLQATLDGTAWKIFLSKRQEAFSVTTALIAQPDFALGGRLLLPLPDAPDPIKLTDPIVGDDLVIVPLAQSQAFNVGRRIPHLAIIPAAQGLVIKPLADKVLVRAVSDGVEITAEGGLLLSRASDTGSMQQSAARTKTVAAGKSIFDFSSWAGKPGETFTQTRQRLQQTIVDVPEAERNRARIELARFYFAKGFGEEAISLLEFLAKRVPDLRFHKDFMALLGAAKILAYRSEDGLRDLATPGLEDQPEAGLWQAVGLAQTREWKQAEERFSTKENILAGYPEPFYSRFFVLAIESAIAANQIHEAADWLNFVSNSPHLESINPALAFLRGTLEAQAGHADEARKAWKEARNSNDRLYKVRAELALIDLDVSSGSLTPAQAADRLEALRFGWRGDDLEAEILHRLGQFYIQAKNIKAGINVMSRIATLFPTSSLTPFVRNEMAAAFRDVFLGSQAKLSPLDALTLYRQYRDMLPSGKERDTIMIHLAERLVSVDLLDQAASLLEDLARNHLEGQEKYRAILRLSAIRLLDHKPTEALAALEIFGNTPLEAGLQNERVLLQARALSELHKDADASSLLKDNASPDAILLRVDIAMRSQKWGEAAQTLLSLVGSPPAAGKALSPDQANWLVHAAIAYALADDQLNLDKLAIDYGPGMSKHVQYGTFQMLTRPEKSGQLRDLAAAQAQLSQVDMFQSFLNSYRKSSTGASEKSK